MGSLAVSRFNLILLNSFSLFSFCYLFCFESYLFIGFGLVLLLQYGTFMVLP
jgi:hypothetical protein